MAKWQDENWTELCKLSKEFNWTDSPHALTEIRNSLVHPEHKQQGKYDGANAVACARIYRIRKNLQATTLYFDAAIPLEPPVELSTLGIIVPDSKSSISRLDWTTFEGVLKTTVDVDFTKMPILKGDSVYEKAYLRELFQLAVMDDLLGPAGGPHEEIVGMSVRDRYLVGKLIPVTPTEEECIEGLKGATAEEDPEAAGELQPFTEVGEGKKKGGRRRLPGEEFNTARGASDPDDDESSAVDASKNQSFVPSSVGMTFCVDGDAKSIELEACWGRYERTESEEQTHESGKPLRAWKRIPSGGRIEIAMTDGVIKPFAPDSNCPRVLVQGTVRAPLESGDRLVILFLINDQQQPEKNQDEAWVFQPELIVRSSNGETVFRRRPLLDTDGRDAERESLEMIYRKQVEFAVGHSISVCAVPSDEEPDRAIEIRTTILPQHEVPITETPGLDPEDRPAMRRMVDEGFLDMSVLAELDRPALVKALSILTNDYETLIGEQRKRIGIDVVGYDDSANRAMDRCNEILVRLREGVATLDKNDDALKAFSFCQSSDGSTAYLKHLCLEATSR